MSPSVLLMVNLITTQFKSQHFSFVFWSSMSFILIDVFILVQKLNKSQSENFFAFLIVGYSYECTA